MKKRKDVNDYIDKFVQKIEDDYFDGDWSGFVSVLFTERDQDFKTYVNEDILITDCAKELGEKEFYDVVSFIKLNNEIENEYGFRIINCCKTFGKDNSFYIENDGRYNINFKKDGIEIDKDINLSDYIAQEKPFGELVENEINFEEILEEFEEEKVLNSDL